MQHPRALGRYELVHLLGQGGMGEVYLAKISGAAGFEKPCIVKTILPSLLKDRQFLERFHHEARVLVHLVHSSIAQVYDMDEADGTYYMALEYVAGVDLAYLQEQAREQGLAIPVPVALYIGQRMAEGLGYAHRKAGPDGLPLGIVHRDVSPHNVMLSYEGEVKVIDFGLAKSAARSKQTLPSTVMGKLGYMSPEQVRAEELDHRSDIYSCGVVIWELLAGRPLIPSGTMGEMMAAMTQPSVPALHELRPDVEPSLDAVVRRALAPTPGERYARADDLARALNEQLLRSGAALGAEEVGNFVRALCPEAFATQRKIASRISGSGLRRAPLTPPPPSPSGTARYAAPSAPELPSGFEATVMQGASGPARPVSAAPSTPGLSPAPVSAPTLVPASTSGVAPVSVPTAAFGVAPMQVPAPASMPAAASGVAPMQVPAPAPMLSGGASMPAPAPAPRGRGRVVALTLAALGLVGVTAGITSHLTQGVPVNELDIPAHLRERALADGLTLPEPPRLPGPGHPQQKPGAAPPVTGAAPDAGQPGTALGSAGQDGGIATAPAGKPPAKETADGTPPLAEEKPDDGFLSPKAVVVIFPSSGSFVLQANRRARLSEGMVLPVVGPPEKDGRRRRLGEATVVNVGPRLTQVELDAEARKASVRRYVALPEQPASGAEATTPAHSGAGAADAGTPAGPGGLVGHVSMKGTGALTQVVIHNQDDVRWTRCSVILSEGRRYRVSAIARGGSHAIPLRRFRHAEGVRAVGEDTVGLSCTEGEADFPVRP